MPGPPQSTLSAFALTLAALVAFATNSVLCRLALGSATIDPYSFTVVRVGSGALALLLLSAVRQRQRNPDREDWSGTLFLLAYALPFSLAYVWIDTGTGALLLFASVQVTMIGHGIRLGQRPRPLEWLGLLGAASGVTYLVSPGLTAPHPGGAALMIVAGASWGGYSIVGKTATDKVHSTTTHFRRGAVCLLPVVVLTWGSLHASLPGLLAAVGSGVFASAMGYTIWYTALKHLSLTRAALVQLSVPVIAAAGGVAFVGETVTLRLALASVIILGSIALGTLDRTRI